MNKKELNNLKQELHDAFINYQAYNYLYVFSINTKDKWDLYELYERWDDMDIKLPKQYDIDIEDITNLDEFIKSLNGYLAGRSTHYSLKLKELVKID